MNVILSCLPLKDRLAFVYCHGHYHEMSWFLFPIFSSNELRPLDTLVKNLIIIINIIISIITKIIHYYYYLLLEVLTRDFS